MTTALIPDLFSASNAAWDVYERHVMLAGRHLVGAGVAPSRRVAEIYREIAEEQALEAVAAMLEARDLGRLAREARR